MQQVLCYFVQSEAYKSFVCQEVITCTALMSSGHRFPPPVSQASISSLIEPTGLTISSSMYSPSTGTNAACYEALRADQVFIQSTLRSILARMLVHERANLAISGVVPQPGVGVGSSAALFPELGERAPKTR